MISILDQDLYKLTMQQAVLKLYPRAVAKYQFVNRNPNQCLTEESIESLRKAIIDAGKVALTSEEESWLRLKCPYLYPWYIDWLKGFRLNPDYVKINVGNSGADGTFKSDQLSISIEGPWGETIYWEVPLLALITERLMWQQLRVSDCPNYGLVAEIAENKGRTLSSERCFFAEFGTRRRYSYRVQDCVIDALRKSAGGYLNGTSNVHFAHKYGIKPIGTMAHEWIQAISGLVGLRHANKYAMEAWNSVYEGRLGIALTDTFGTDAFFGDFNGVYARLFDGVRQDSGDPVVFIRKAIDHYRSLGIDPTTKSVILSDSLTVDKCSFYQRCFGDKVRLSFGIGTHLTNDVPSSVPPNVVIKLVEIDGIPVVKLSDDPRKAIGDPRAIEVAKWTFGIKDK